MDLIYDFKMGKKPWANDHIDVELGTIQAKKKLSLKGKKGLAKSLEQAKSAFVNFNQIFRFSDQNFFFKRK